MLQTESRTVTAQGRDAKPQQPAWLAPNGLRVLERRYLLKDASGKFLEDATQLFQRVSANQAHIDGLWGVIKAMGIAALGRTPDLLSDAEIAKLKTEEGRSDWSAPVRTAYTRAFKTASDDYNAEILGGNYMPSTPILINSGAKTGMLYSCFVLPMDDTLMSKPGEEDHISGIFDTVRAVVAVQRSGGGTGVSVSRMRPRADTILGGMPDAEGAVVLGHTTGPMSWLKAVSDGVANIEQGSARNGANMGILRVDHPDVIEFATTKDGIALRNFNISVAMTDVFITQLQKEPGSKWMVRNPRSGALEVCRDKLNRSQKGTQHEWTVQEVWDLIVHRAWEVGDPGLWFIDRVNATNPTPNLGNYEACNPCGEQELLPHESCNLGSVILSRFVDAKTKVIDWVRMETTVRRAVRFHDAVIDSNVYPVEVPQIRKMTKATRKIGIGVMGWWDMLVRMGIPYESDAGVKLADEVMGRINRWAEEESVVLATERGTFPAFKGSREEKQGRRTRNATRTTIAPTGTISILANASGGIEPSFGLAFLRTAPGIGDKVEEINPTFKLWLEVAEQNKRLTAAQCREILESAFRGESVSQHPLLSPEERMLFRVANEIPLEWHIKHQAAFQRHTNNAVSKTINVHNTATTVDIDRAYRMAIDAGLKGITVFRDGCLDKFAQKQPMAFKKKEEKPKEESTPSLEMLEAVDRKLDREALAKHRETVPCVVLGHMKPVNVPPVRPSITVTSKSPVGVVHLHLSIDTKTGFEVEVFGCVGKAGDLKLAQMEGMGRLISTVLRLGGGLDLVVAQLHGIGSKHTSMGAGGRHLSLEDTVGHMLAKYLETKKRYGWKALVLGEVPEAELTVVWRAPLEEKAKALDAMFGGPTNGNGHGNGQPNGTGGPKNDNTHGLVCANAKCGAEVLIVGGCAFCPSCGTSSC